MPTHYYTISAVEAAVVVAAVVAAVMRRGVVPPGATKRNTSQQIHIAPPEIWYTIKSIFRNWVTGYSSNG
jgi:hypothetical protein